MMLSLRWRITLIFIGLAVGPLLLVGATIGQRSYTNLVQQSLALQHNVAETVANEIRAFMAQHENELVLLNRIYALGVLPAKEQQTLLNSMLLYQRVFQELILLDREGQERMRLSRSELILEADLKNRAGHEEFVVPFTQRQTYYSPVRFDSTLREPLITMSIPLVDLRSGKVVAVLVADLRFKLIWDLLDDLELPPGGDAYVVDQAGKVIAHKNPTIVLQGTTIELPLEDEQTQGLAGVEVIMARDILQFGNQRLFVVAEQAVSNALELAADSLRIALAVTIVMFALAVILIVLTTRRVIRPIEVLARSARAISKGDFSMKVDISGGDEVGQLASAFNQMISDLETSYTKISQYTSELQVKNAQLERDITARRRAEEELRRYQEQLEDLVRERTAQLEAAQKDLIRQERLAVLGQLAATVAHEIRNPLGTVRTSVFAIGDAVAHNQLGRIERARKLAERNIIRCDTIIDELLEYTRHRELQLQPLNIDGWLQNVLDDQNIPADIVLTRKLHAGMELLIDSESLRRALINVLDNALQALHDERAPGNQITVSTGVVANRVANRVAIRVCDTGCGIPDEVLEKIFEPLFSTKSFGVGLGMPIVKKIMEQHQGGIEIESKAGAGTTVTLWLPNPREGALNQ